MDSDNRSRYWAGRRVALTGATGFVGHHVAVRLARQGARVVALVRGTSQCERLQAAGIACAAIHLEEAASLVPALRGCEVLFHLAGAVDFQDDWGRFERVNVGGTRQVLGAARAAGVRRLVHTSSVVAVGARPRPVVLDETAPWTLGGLRVPYVTTKRRAEELALEASGKSLEVVVVNPSVVLGPDDFSGSEFGTLCKRFWRGRLPFFFGSGNNFVDVRDVARGQLLAGERGRPGQRYVLGGTNRTYTALFADLARVARRPIFRLRLPCALAGMVARLNGTFQRSSTARAYLTAGQARLLPLYFFFSSAKAESELGYRTRPLEESLADAHAFWKERQRRQPA
jgi:dihydroflavonol-4-reductase